MFKRKQRVADLLIVQNENRNDNVLDRKKEELILKSLEKDGLLQILHREELGLQ